MKKISAIVLLIFFSAVMHNGYAQIGVDFCDARTGGINGGLTAAADDIFSIQYNPAGLSRLPFPEIASSIGSPHTGLSDGTNMQKSLVAYAHPFRHFIPWRREDRYAREKAVGVGWYQFSSGTAFTENVLYVSYAQEVYSRLSLGITYKRLSRAFRHDPYMNNAVDTLGNLTGARDPFFETGRSRTASTGDFGALYRFGDFSRYAVGFAVRNITQPDLALGTTEDRVPLITAGGFSYRFPKLTAGVDWTRGKFLGGHTENQFTFAGEKWFLFEKIGRIAARGLLGFGSRNYRAFSLGSSYLYNRIRIDYGFSIPLSGIENTAGSHYMNVSFRFGDQEPEEYFSPELRQKRDLRRLAENELARARKARKEAENSTKQALLEMETIRKLTLEMASRNATKRAERSEKKAYDLFKRVYEIILEVYDRKIKTGYSLKNRMIFLERTIGEFEKLDVDVSSAQKELRKVKNQYENLVEEYRQTLLYYRKLVERGASLIERADILKRIMKKYSKHHIDLSEAELELKKLYEAQQ